MIQIYDSFTKTKKVLTNNKQVNLYVCGPTVYNYIHIGNARPVVIMDILHRLLKHQQYQINYVHNITDIDDKIIAAASEGKTTEQKITTKFLSAYLEDLSQLNILLPTTLPKVSDIIPDIIKFIADLIDNDSAYVIEGDVYFSIDKIPSYGDLSNKKIADLKPNYESEIIKRKRNPLDFALWKQTKEGLKWDSPWGKGRPGWHTECVVFIQNAFKGERINLHGGGIDLKFPHHENERAQFLAHNNKELAEIWWHNGHIHIEDEKMSKSLNNMILVKDFCTNNSPLALRYLLINHDHQQPFNFNDDLVKEANVTIKKFHDILKLCSYWNFINKINVKPDHDKDYYEAVIEALEDNIDTTKVLYHISAMIKDLNQAIKAKDFSVKYQAIFQALIFTLKIIGFNFHFGNYSVEEQREIINWEKLKADKLFVEADLVRAKLQKNGILPE